MYKILYRCSRLERSYQPQLAEWVSVALGALGAGMSILGGLSSANAAKRAEKLRQEQDARNAAWFNRKYNESYIDTAAGRNAIRQAIDYGKRQTQRAEGAAAVTGGTDAAVAQAKEGANKMVGDTIGNLAAQDTARKEQAEATYLRQQEQSTAQQMANQQQRANAIAQAAQGASNALMQGASLLGESSGKTDAAQNLTNGQTYADASEFVKEASKAQNITPAAPTLDAAQKKLYQQRHGLTVG